LGRFPREKVLKLWLVLYGAEGCKMCFPLRFIYNPRFSHYSVVRSFSVGREVIFPPPPHFLHHPTKYFYRVELNFSPCSFRKGSPFGSGPNSFSCSSPFGPPRYPFLWFKSHAIGPDRTLKYHSRGSSPLRYLTTPPRLVWTMRFFCDSSPGYGGDSCGRLLVLPLPQF